MDPNFLIISKLNLRFCVKESEQLEKKFLNKKAWLKCLNLNIEIIQ